MEIRQDDIDAVAKILCRVNGDNPRMKGKDVKLKSAEVVKTMVWHDYRNAAERAIIAHCHEVEDYYAGWADDYTR